MENNNFKKYKYDSDWINKLENIYHWKLYWWQQKLMYDFIKPNSKALEIGVGTQFTSNYLKSKNINVTTVDIDENKNPDIVANIVSYKLKEKYDYILAFEVFEHIPYEEFLKTIDNIKNNTNYLFISLPLLKKKIFEIKLLLPIIHHVKYNIFIPKKKITTQNHHWEIGKNSVSEKKFKTDVLNSGYIIKKEFVFDSFLYMVLETSFKPDSNN